MAQNFLLVDDEKFFCDSLKRGLRLCGFQNIKAETDPRKAADLIEQGELVDIALLDITMPGMDGVELLEVIRGHSPTTECIMISAVNEVSLAVDCIKKGAFDYLVKPLDMEELRIVIFKALERKNFVEIQRLGKSTSIPGLINPTPFAPIITQSDKMHRMMKEAELHADSMVPVLITGETGTGKELMAKAIHMASPRAEKTYTPINMTALTASLFEAEFYGHKKGAFTGADHDRKGYIETTSGGTLFLDEIGNLPLELQGKLLRVLQEGEYFKLGTSRPLGANVRFITATNVESEKLQDPNIFRRDLFYRLCGAWLNLPPLRERKGDLGILVEAFLQEYGITEGAINIEEPVWSVLQDYDYPGNIRELKSIVQHAANLARGLPITIHHLPDYLTAMIPKKDQSADLGRPDTIISLQEIEKEHILRVYRYTNGNKARTAQLLKIGISTLRRKLDSY